MTIGQGAAYCVAAINIAAGILVATDILFKDLPLSSMRITLGIVLILLGIHRVAATKMKSGRQENARA